MSRASYVYVVSDDLGVLYATDRKYEVRRFFDREHRPGLMFKVDSVRWDGNLTQLDSAEFITTGAGE